MLQPFRFRLDGGCYVTQRNTEAGSGVSDSEILHQQLTSFDVELLACEVRTFHHEEILTRVTLRGQLQTIVVEALTASATSSGLPTCLTGSSLLYFWRSDSYCSLGSVCSAFISGSVIARDTDQTHVQQLGVNNTGDDAVETQRREVNSERANTRHDRAQCASDEHQARNRWTFYSGAARNGDRVCDIAMRIFDAVECSCERLRQLTNCDSRASYENVHPRNARRKPSLLGDPNPLWESS
jgi:hypothetical protein